ncbi:hypothetical protein [Mesorhizobium kowhaii]|uniref:Uncharacterized protein n=1 Tax=Mesorhizobium kowhaii TaxID=1300272 RepID=A0A2W7E0M6_9HYPH|nr:hypothetical protein [Mesorhizobium kowhaii]PZV36886.1 hypothetical protein B5V02_19485 [Mesorhizobium kowhaii]
MTQMRINCFPGGGGFTMSPVPDGHKPQEHCPGYGDQPKFGYSDDGVSQTLTSLEPNVISASKQLVWTIVVKGTRFNRNTSIVHFDGQPVQTDYETPTALRATVVDSFGTFKSGRHSISVVDLGRETDPLYLILNDGHAA